MEKLNTLLQMYVPLSEQSQSNSRVTISMVLPMYNQLMTWLETYMEQLRTSDPNSKLLTAVERAFKKVVKYYNLTNNIYIVATVLDPRFKLAYFSMDKRNDKISNNTIIQTYFISSIN